MFEGQPTGTMLTGHHLTLEWLSTGIALMRELEDNDGLTIDVLVAFYSAIQANATEGVEALTGCK